MVREWVAPATAVYIINELATKYDTDPDVRNLLNKYDWYILPIANPDGKLFISARMRVVDNRASGYQYTWWTNRLWRKNRALPKAPPFRYPWALFDDCIGELTNWLKAVSIAESQHQVLTLTATSTSTSAARRLALTRARTSSAATIRFRRKKRKPSETVFSHWATRSKRLSLCIRTRKCGACIAQFSTLPVRYLIHFSSQDDSIRLHVEQIAASRRSV